ncbi:hypothetical protein TM45_08630 [Campylobacter jejuni subsp. jejuni]|nr:hypothetical protein TM45_08630 [Campylobacter jejuni subsp. jejuni]
MGTARTWGPEGGPGHPVGEWGSCDLHPHRWIAAEGTGGLGQLMAHQGGPPLAQEPRCSPHPSGSAARPPASEGSPAA